jgi:glycine dehydrogenase subunit 1
MMWVKKHLTKFTKDYCAERFLEVLNKVGIKDVNELFTDVPEKITLKRRLNLPEPLSEKEVESYICDVLGRNKCGREYLTFLGGGLPPHYVPAAVENIVSRNEFCTAYTPYQPEISQGILQALFEYQSVICDLTGMDVANSSMYDWATATAEAVRMVIRVKGNKTVLLARNIGPERKKVIKTYLEPLGTEIQEVEYLEDKGRIDISDLENKLKNTCCFYFENPNYFGVLEKETSKIIDLVHNSGGLVVVGVDPISLAIVKPPGEYGVDIVVGEGQILGTALNFGGPSLGIFACRGDQSLVRQMPGRIIGMTTTLVSDERAFTMVLQTREQHIRRENATSNICSNEALLAVGAISYLAVLGTDGLRSLAVEIVDKCHQASRRLSEVRGIKAPLFSGEFFQEFTIKSEKIGLYSLFKALLDRRIIPGIILDRDFPELKNVLLSCITEIHRQEDIERFAEAVEEAVA